MPINAYNVKCANCGKLFSYKEIGEYEKELNEILGEEERVVKDRDSQLELLQQMKDSSDVEFKSKIGQLQDMVQENEKKLLEFRVRRTMIK